MSHKPFSQRNTPDPEHLSEEIPLLTRRRIMHTLEDVVGHIPGGSFHAALEEAGKQALKRYGKLDTSITGRPVLQAADHFLNCSAERLIDMLEWLFRSRFYAAGQTGVDEVNEIFREAGVGFEFTPYVVKEVTLPNTGGAYVNRTQYPEGTRKTSEVMHSSTVMPALQLLSGAAWVGANEEMLKSHEHYRHGNFADAIHWAGKCLESVLQIICDKKQWPFTPDKDTLNPLLQACYKGALFPSPYIEIIQKSSGEIRNKWSGHGSAKSSHGPATADMAEHMIQITSAHVLFLARRAKL